MIKLEKQRVVEELTQKLLSSAGVYLANYKGLNVQEISDLRNQLRQAAIELKVVKNTLAKISVTQVGLEDLTPYLTGPTAIAFCRTEPITGAKILTEFQKQNTKLELKACVFDHRVYDKKYIDEISKLPPVAQIRAQTIGMIGAPLRNLVGVLNNLVTTMVTVLNEIKKQREN